MGDPVSFSTGAKLAGTVFSGISAFQGRKAQQKAAERNAFVGRTRALQSDAAARAGLESELGTMRAVMGANAQGANVGTFEMFKALRETRGRERDVEFGNRMNEVYGFRTDAANNRRAAAMTIPVTLGQSAQSIFSLYDHNQQLKAERDG